MTTMSTVTMDGSSGGAAQRSEFELSEIERRRSKVAVLDAIADGRARWIELNSYYTQQVYRLVGANVLPNSRVLEVGCGLGDLVAALETHGCKGVGIDISPRMIELAKERHPQLDLRRADVERDALPEGPFDAIVFSDAVGHLDDIERAFERVRPLLAPGGRIIVTYYNFVWEPALKAAERVGRKTPWPEQNWLSMNDIANLLYLSGFQLVRRGTDVLVPADLPLVSEVANRVLVKLPGLREAALVHYFVARAVPEVDVAPLPSVSVVCPCRNEKGNIRAAVARTPQMGKKTELVFVDGSSTDGTVAAIERHVANPPEGLSIRLLHQGDGRGKGDAVRKGFAAAKNDLLFILDADLTVPPEDLPKFYAALAEGKGEFVNGTRLVYPMEGEAMRFLNLLGNKFFSVTLSAILEQRLKDTLCGTKVLRRTDWDRIVAGREFFGDFDPFGDFDLLFGAAKQNMKIVEMPIRYRDRTYGETKISRFRHGWLLARMTWFAYRKFRGGA